MDDAPVTEIIDELSWRGLIAISTDLDDLRKALDTDRVTFYAGFDPTGPGLHIGQHLTTLDFLRDIGKHFPVNQMLSRDVVRNRLDRRDLFHRVLLHAAQAYDFLELYRRDGVTLQLGGSDQWGNITAGIELIRRAVGAEVHGLTVPLLTIFLRHEVRQDRSGRCLARVRSARRRTGSTNFG